MGHVYFQTVDLLVEIKIWYKSDLKQMNWVTNTGELEKSEGKYFRNTLTQREQSAKLQHTHNNEAV